MTIQKTHIAALALAGALTVAVATPSMADSRWGYAAGGFAAGALVGSAIASNNAYYGHPGYAYGYAPQSYAYAPAQRYVVTPGHMSYSQAPVYDPENGGWDPDPRIGGSFKMNSSGDD